MSKLSRAMKALGRIARKPWLLNLVLDDNEAWKETLEKHHAGHFSFPTADIRLLLTPEGCHLPVFAFLDGGSIPTDLTLLRSLAASIPDCQYFEIGTWRGESVANVAGVAAHCHTLNLSAEEMKVRGWSGKYAELHGFFSSQLTNVTHLYGDSATYDFAGLNKKFDLVFIDGDHHYEMVRHDTYEVFTHLVHENTIVVWHDAAFTPEKLRHEVIAGILDGTPEHTHSRIYHVSNSQCAIYYPKGLEGARELDVPEKPVIRFEVDIRLNPA